MMNWIRGVLATIGNFAVGKAVPAVIIAVLGILGVRILAKLVSTALGKSKLDKAAHKPVVSVLQIVLFVILGLIIASRLGIDVTSVVALASVLTLAISLSVQNALTNLFGGFTLLYTKPFVIGDFVEIAGQSGTVQEVGLTYTKLVTVDNRLISLPNSSVTAGQIINFSTAGTRRMEILVSASYDAPISLVLETLTETANIPTVLADPAIFAGVNKYGDNAIEYVLRFWCNNDVAWDAYFEINKSIKSAFDAKGIQMTYPHINVHLDK